MNMKVAIFAVVIVACPLLASGQNAPDQSKLTGEKLATAFGYPKPLEVIDNTRRARIGNDVGEIIWESVSETKNEPFAGVRVTLYKGGSKFSPAGMEKRLKELQTQLNGFTDQERQRLKLRIEQAKNEAEKAQAERRLQAYETRPKPEMPINKIVLKDGRRGYFSTLGIHGLASCWIAIQTRDKLFDLRVEVGILAAKPQAIENSDVQDYCKKFMDDPRAALEKATLNLEELLFSKE